VHNIKYMHLKHIPLLGAGVNVNLKWSLNLFTQYTHDPGFI
jgi:hypothetical protein